MGRVHMWVKAMYTACLDELLLQLPNLMVLYCKVVQCNTKTSLTYLVVLIVKLTKKAVQVFKIFGPLA